MSKEILDSADFSYEALQQIFGLINSGFDIDNKKDKAELIDLIQKVSVTEGKDQMAPSEVREVIEKSQIYQKANNNLKEQLLWFIDAISKGFIFEDDKIEEMIKLVNNLDKWQIENLQANKLQADKLQVNKPIENQQNFGITKEKYDNLKKSANDLFKMGYKGVDIAAMVRAVREGEEFDPIIYFAQIKTLNAKNEQAIRINVTDLAQINNQELFNKIMNQASNEVRQSQTPSIKDRFKSLQQAGLKGEFNPALKGFDVTKDQKNILTRRGQLHGKKDVEEFIKEKDEPKPPTGGRKSLK